jgi:hypothetical protein
MKANIKTIALGIFVCVNQYLQAQVSSTNAELHNRYWNYRENFRKYFVILNEKPGGGGMPFSDIQPNHSPENHKVDASGNYISGGTLKGNVNVGGDVTAYYSEYLAVLAQSIGYCTMMVWQVAKKKKLYSMNYTLLFMPSIDWINMQKGMYNN